MAAAQLGWDAQRVPWAQRTCHAWTSLVAPSVLGHHDAWGRAVCDTMCGTTCRTLVSPPRRLGLRKSGK